MTEALDKQALFRRLGYGGEYHLLEAVLEEARLSRPERSGISPAKEEEVRELLAAFFLAVCSRGDCQADADAIADGLIVVPAADQDACGVCGGSANARAVDDLVAAFARAGLRRLCVVGGSPKTRLALEELVDGRIELRLVHGTERRTARDAAADLAWADRIALWGGTILDHKVSNLYRGTHVITVVHRGIQHLARGVSKALG